MNEILLISLASVVSMIGIWLWWFIYRRAYLLDLFRQRIFDLRDDMFLYCAENGIDFNHKAYTLLRTRQNGLIRYAEHLNFSTLLSANLFRDDGARSKRHTEEIEEAIKALPTVEAREKFDMAHILMVFFIVDYIARNSLVVMVLSSVVLLVLRISKFCGRYLLASRSRTDSVRKDAALLVPGVHDIEEDAAEMVAA